MKCLRIKFEGVWSGIETEECSRDNHSWGIWHWLWFLCGVGHYGRDLISAFEGLFASIEGAFILAGGLGNGL